FHVTAAKAVKVNMMHETLHGGMYAEDEDKKLLQLPYQGGNLSMVLVLPKKSQGLAAIEKQLSAEGLAAWVGKLAPEQVRVAIPKLQMNTAFELSGTLS